LKEEEVNYTLIDIENPHIDVNETKMKRAEFYRGLGFRDTQVHGIYCSSITKDDAFEHDNQGLLQNG
jgi:hypothetical protein